jgi:hypothetical protein
MLTPDLYGVNRLTRWLAHLGLRLTAWRTRRRFRRNLRAYQRAKLALSHTPIPTEE